MPKEFKTIDELIEILASRNVIIDEDAKLVLSQESYYAIVNGYKDPFLDRKAMTGSHDDIYKKGTHFDWLYTLFLFDRDLRSLTFKYIAKAEAIMKTSVVYAFCENNQEPDSYLRRDCYSTPEDMLVPKGFRSNKKKFYAKNMSRLMEVLNSKASGDDGKSFVRHYVSTYGFVPLWVLSNDLTFGHMAHFYQLQKRSVQNRTCKLIMEATERPNLVPGVITPQSLLHAFSVLVDFRNICAHDERLYCARAGRSKDIQFNQMSFELYKMLPGSVFDLFIGEIGQLFAKYGDRLHGVTRDSLMQDMGFSLKEE